MFEIQEVKMKFDKKVMESGMVVTFTLVMTFSSVCTANTTAQAAKYSRAVELTAEQVRESDAVKALIMDKKPEAKMIREIFAEAIENKGVLNDAEILGMAETDTEEKNFLEIEKNENNNIFAEIEIAGQAEMPVEEMSGQEDISEIVESAKEETEEEIISAEVEETSAQENVLMKAEAEKAAAEAARAEEKAAAEAAEAEENARWESKLLPEVEEYLNIRTEASDESEVAGKLYKASAADVIEVGEEWTKISSGNVEGYVKNEYCVTGTEAKELANQVGVTYATATTGGVRVRETASSEESTTIVDVLEEGGKIKVDTEAEAAEGWVAVKVNDKTAYVSEEFVNVELELGKAVSIEEERAAIAAAEAEKAKKAQAQQQGAAVAQRDAVAASYDDVTLLGALIQCEAGSECYEGQVAVGAVVMNRLRAGYAGSISGVIYQSGQFTPASSGSLASVLASGVSGSCLQAAQEAIGGVDNVGGATSFRGVSSGMSGLVIGNHVFF